jgi:hypothetical protein
MYDAPEDIQQLPAMVLVPGDPWCQVSGLSRAGVVQWNYTLALMVHRAPVEASIQLIESLRPLVVEGIGTLGGQWSMMRKPDTLEVSGLQALVAELDLTILTERQT